MKEGDIIVSKKTRERFRVKYYDKALKIWFIEDEFPSEEYED